MANDGIITRKDIIQDEALRWGEEYAKNVEKAIKANDQMVLLTKELKRLYEELKKVQNNSELTKKQEEFNKVMREATQEAKKIHQAEIANEKIKQEKIKTLREEAIAEQKLAQEKQKTIAATVRAEEVERKANVAKEKGTKLTIEERVQNEQNNRILKQQAMEKLGLIGAYQKLNKERTEAKRKVMDLIASESASTAEIKKAQKEFDVLDKKVRKADKAVGDFTKNVGNYPFRSIASNIRDLVGAFGVTLGIAAFANAVKNAWKTVKEFDTAITELSAVTEIPKKQLGSLKNTIIDVSKTSVNSATDVAKLAVELSKLGASVPQIEAMIETVDRFSVAMEASGEDSARFLLGVMNSFGASAEESERYGDVMAQAANISALGFEELKNTLKTFAPVANAANLSIERASALAGVLVDNNIEATTAGTSLRSIFIRLASSGLSYSEAMAKINNSTDKLSTATQLFGRESATSALILAQNNEKLAEYEEKLNDSTGALEALNETKMDSLENQVKALSSAWDGLILSIENGDGAISKFVKGTLSLFIEGINGLSEAIKSNEKQLEGLRERSYKTGFEDQTKQIDDLVEHNVLLEKANDLRGKYGISQDEAYKMAIDYYKNEKDEINNLILLEKERIKNSSLFTKERNDLIEKIQKSTNEIDKQKKKVDDLNKSVEEGGLIGNVFLRRYEVLDKETKKLERDISVLNSYQAKLDALNKYNTNNDTVTTTTETDSEKAENARKAREEAEKKRLAMLKKAFEEEHQLNIWRLNRTKELNQEVVDDENTTIDERIEAYLRIQELDQAIARETAEYKLRQLTEFTEGARKLSKSEIDALLDNASTRKDLTDAEQLILDELQAKRDDINKRQEKNIQKLIDLEAKRITDGVEKELGGFKNEENQELTSENNAYQQQLELYGYTEQAEEEHQKRLLEIKNRYLKQGLQAEIDAYDQIVANADLSQDAKEKAAEKSLELKRQLSELELEVVRSAGEKELQLELQKEEFIKELRENAKQATIELINTIFEAKIQKIDDEIRKNEEYYARQIELAGEDKVQRELLEAEAEKKRQDLEKKKRQEQTKQAIFNKSVKLIEIGWATALGIMNAVSLFPLTGGMPWSAIVAGIGAAQAASVIASPIPKYKTGRKGGPKEKAILGDGGVPEVLERKRGGFEITPAYDTLYQLEQGDIVHKSVDDFFKSKLNTINRNLWDSQSKMDKYQESVVLNFTNDPELLQEMKRVTEAVRKSKPTIVQSGNFDINYELWRMNQTKWNN
ncbi:phage tail tape measure protein [Flavobacterium agricola]|uniref:Phage tail tape measure protein n=1 Tax=Flavobacterium agricola TaxID=2870839 RepID=A0ABY6M0T3_9FLAO|nr:phage tail tape measure protein [Flavobacterium agricola]UYW02114.1 phage tail tape measure protein [Flavobacterium agricola]